MTDKTIVIIIYERAEIKFEFTIIIVWCVKADIVVNEPKKPIIKKYYSVSFVGADIPINKPIKKHPTTLIKSVPDELESKKYFSHSSFIVEMYSIPYSLKSHEETEGS